MERGVQRMVEAGVTAFGKLSSTLS